MEVGFQLYNDMLAEAVRVAEGRPRARPAARRSSATTEINLHAPALLPDAYCGDVHMRLSLYKRLASGEQGRADRRAARGDHRPLRQAAAAGAGAVRRAPPARARQAVRRREDRRRRRSVMTITFAPNPPVDADAHHRAGAEEPPHQARRQRQAAHRARRARRARTASQLVRDVLRSLGAPKVLEAAHERAAGATATREVAPGLRRPRLRAAAAPRRLRA